MMTLARCLLDTDELDSRRRFRRQLLRWYDLHKRDLRWRRDRDPYRVWLSEVMLQQTRVAAVLEHYGRFLKLFPAVERLAAARESSVLAAWSGLGYYRRARMLHAAARKIVSEHRGRFPTSTKGLRALPGIGPYTAAAIASIAFGKPVAAVDGNVERVLGRVQGKNLVGEQLWQTAEELLSRHRPGDFNQAMMELGATVCLPRHPKCLMCPVFDLCATRGELGKQGSGTRQKQQKAAYAFDCRNGSVFLVKRPKDASLMPGMWELPEIENINDTREAFLTLRHSITVTNYLVRIMKRRSPDGTEGKWVPKGRVALLPLTGLARKILRAANVI
jgi:A/G-specific adenine glycosylase